MVAEGSLGPAAKVVFGPMLNFLTFAYSTWRLNDKEKFALRASVYKEQFFPAFEKLAEIHQDYMKSLHEFYEIAKKFQTPQHELIAKFRRYGIEYASWREDVKCFTEVCGVLSKNTAFKNEKDAITEFSNSIRDYFAATSPDGSRLASSWFSSFLNEFQMHAREGRSPWDAEYEGMGYHKPKDALMDYLRKVYQIELPQRWARVTKAKATLQGVLVVPSP